MPWRMDFEEAGEMLCITNEASVTLAELQQQATEAVTALVEHESVRLLVDNRQLSADDQPSRLYELPQFDADMELPGGTRIAVVTDLTDYPAEDLDAYDELCRQRGFEVRLFNGEAAARKWLEKG